MVICLERGAGLHTAQLMPLPLTVSCFSKIPIAFTFLVLAYPGSPGKGPLNGYVRACVNAGNFGRDDDDKNNPLSQWILLNGTVSVRPSVRQSFNSPFVCPVAAARSKVVRGRSTALSSKCGQ